MKINITIVLPIRNEEKSIKTTLSSIIDELLEDMELLIVDGMSDDNTINIVNDFIQQHQNHHIRVLENKYKTVPYAMNRGIQEAQGEYIIRLDAHSKYPKNYIKDLIFFMEKLGADNVGGVVETLPANDTLEATAIALATSHPFGVGNSYFRVGTNDNEPILVDTVPFGCYKKEMFDKIGLYDTDLTRNQDDELNARLIQNGGKIFLIPSIKIKYYARDKFKKVFQMFYQYGLFKPLVNLKLKKPATLRQFIPPLFVAFLLFGVIFSFFSSYIKWGFVSIFTLYMGLNFYVSYSLAKKYKKMQLLFYLMYTFLIIHIAYGVGYWRGIFDFVVRNKHINVDINR
ncbi:Glycosyltransferase [hydrothermal vent metagenome]|uniref:Glycosyltransferase n=1 Tax=hydrothermal vent metagenome TaxID=652676 RepID=A0A1W1D329_9ZZZZ